MFNILINLTLPLMCDQTPPFVSGVLQVGFLTF